MGKKDVYIENARAYAEILEMKSYCPFCGETDLLMIEKVDSFGLWSYRVGCKCGTLTREFMTFGDALNNWASMSNAAFLHAKKEIIEFEIQHPKKLKKHCPFYGSEAVPDLKIYIKKKGMQETRLYSISCKCGAETKSFRSKKQAIRSWNNISGAEGESI